MATRTWTGTTSGDWGVTTNWSPSTVPVSDDDVIIDGTVSITSGLNQSAVDLKSLKVLSTYTGNIGTSGASLQINVTSTGGGNVPVVEVSGNGSFYNLNGNYTTLKINTGLGTTTSIAGGTTTTAYCGSGNVNYAAGAILTNVYVDGASLYAYYNSTAITSAIIGSGMLSTARAITTKMSQGMTKLLASATIATAYLFKGAAFNDQSTGTITTLEIAQGATYSPSGLKGSKTITTLVQHPDSNFIETAPGATLTITTRVRTSQTQAGNNQFFDV
jgi:hypothetical protein